MAAKNKTGPGQGDAPAKATTGAWWKSTSVGGNEKVSGADDAGKETAEKERKPLRSPRRGRRNAAGDAGEEPASGSVDSIRKLPDEGASQTGREVGELPTGVSGGDIVSDGPAHPEPAPEKQTVAKAKRKRPPRKKRPAADTGGSGSVDTVETGQPAGDGEAKEADGIGSQQDAQATVENAPAAPGEEKRSASRRSRRGRRSKRKESVGSDTGEKSVRAADSDDEDAEHGETPGRQQSGKDRALDREETGFFISEDGFVEEDEDDGGPDDEQPSANAHKPVCKLLINAEEPEECRLALLEDGRLESIHVSTVNRTQTKNNIYKARIVAIEPNLQAAFVDYGTEKNGFLPFSEIHPEYFRQDMPAETRKLVEAQNWKKLSITDVLEKGQEVLVQVVKEEVGKKGANMTTYLSLPGRCVVLMPGSESSGISRKISGEEKRSQLREAMNSIDIPEGIGWIVRTASVDITAEILARDVSYLLRLWDEIKMKGQELSGVGLVYEEQHSVLRFLREHFDPSIEEILVDDKDALEQVKEFVEMLPAEQRKVRVRLHKGARPIFNQYSVEDQIESIYQSKVNLPSGGSIVIDPTEALVAIDVNSGSTSKGKNFEASIFQANMEAASELARQLRLRDLGGLIVIDFIDMRSKKHIRDVENQVKKAMKRDKAKVDISRISKFGLMQISRQKLGAPIEAGNYRVCEHCKGRGMVRSVETLALFYLRRIQTGASRKNVVKVECHFPLDVAHYLLNNKRHELQDLENKYHAEVVIVAKTTMKPADNEIHFHKAEKETAGKNQP